MVSLKGTDLISIRDFDKKTIEQILSVAKKMENKRNKALAGKILATLFFEPSTRTRLSFQSSMLRLGGQVINFGSIEQTSINKGESFTDTIKIVEKYADGIVIRHASEGTARLAAEVAGIPVINAGDGANQHPTQTLIDLYTLQKFKGNISKLNVCLTGDVKYARAMRSLLYALSMFGARVTFASPPGLEMEASAVEEVEKKFGARLTTAASLSEAIEKADVLYVCRIQAERFSDPYEAQKAQREFKLTKELVEQGKKDLIILHPLPKVNEIDPALDETPYAKYFQQAANGIPVRMAILQEILG